MARSSKGGWLLYCMVHIPFVWWWKVGITHASIGALKRAHSIDKAVFGFPLPIFVVPIPFAYFIEQELHRILSPVHFRFYRGDGGSEWFWFVCGFVVLPIMLVIWAGYFALIDKCLGTHILPTISKWLFDALLWVFDLVMSKI